MPGTTDAWRVVGASVRGVSHVRTGQPCQDAHQWQELPGGVLVVAVADGAGSAPLAEIGATLAVRVVIEEAVACLRSAPPTTEQDWQTLVRELLEITRQAVTKEAGARNCPVGDLATTLLFAIATPEQVIAAQVGDGAMVVQLPDQTYRSLTIPAVEEYINETTFLTSPECFDKTQFAVYRSRVNGLALFSDGLQMLALKLREGTPHLPFFTPLFRFVSSTPDRARAEGQLRSFLQSPKIADRADDDLTLVLAVRNAVG